MASLFSKIKSFVHSPEGRRVAEQVKEMAKDPQKRQRAQEKLRKLRKH